MPEGRGVGRYGLEKASVVAFDMLRGERHFDTTSSLNHIDPDPLLINFNYPESITVKMNGIPSFDVTHCFFFLDEFFGEFHRRLFLGYFSICSKRMSNCLSLIAFFSITVAATLDWKPSKGNPSSASAPSSLTPFM